MRVVVVGGSGHLGSRAVAALRALPGAEVVVAGRHPRGPGDLRVDLDDPASFAALEGADAVVNVTDVRPEAAEALARHCLARGLTLLESSADLPVIDRLLRLDGAGAAGTVVLGTGIFPGLSNLLAAEAARAVPGCASLELAVASTPFSGAGRGTVNLMADALGTPAARFVGGRRVDGPPVAPGPEMPFPGGAARTLAVALADPVLVAASTRVPEVAMYMLPRPALLRAAFLALPAALLRSRAFVSFLRGYFALLRRVLLRGRATPVELVARARSASASRVLTLRVDDGMRAGGLALAALVALLPPPGERPRGVVCADALVRLEPLLARMRELAGGSLRLESGASG